MCFTLLRSRGQDAVVLEQHHGFLCGLQGQLAVLGAANHTVGNLGVGIMLGGIEHTQLHAGGEHPAGGTVNVGIGDEPIIVGLTQGVYVGTVATLQVEAGLEGDGRGFLQGSGVVVRREDVLHATAVGDDIAVKAPVAAQYIGQQPGVARAGRTVDGVVGCHDRLGTALGDTGLEGGEIVFAQHLLRCGDLTLETVVLLVVDCEVLGRRYHLEVALVVALQTTDKGRSRLSAQEGIFAVGLCRASPAWVAGHVHRGRPEGEQVAVVERLLASLVEGVPTGSGLIADGCGYLLHQGRIPGGTQGDGLRKHGEAAGAHHAVQRLVAVVVFVNAQPLDAR